jgi:hypothetical protein
MPKSSNPAATPASSAQVGAEPVSQPAKSHPPQQRTRTYVDRGHLKFSIGSWHQEHIGDSGEAATDKVNDLGIEDVPGEPQFPILQVRIWRCDVRREPHSVVRKIQLLIAVGLHQPPRQQVTNATTAAHTKPMHIGVRNVVQDRHIDDPADPNAVGATYRSPDETAQKHRRTGDHSQYSLTVAGDGRRPSASGLVGDPATLVQCAQPSSCWG